MRIWLTISAMLFGSMLAGCAHSGSVESSGPQNPAYGDAPRPSMVQAMPPPPPPAAPPLPPPPIPPAPAEPPPQPPPPTKRTVFPMAPPPPVVGGLMGANLDADLPVFPLPAPRPSARVDLPLTLLGHALTSVGAVEQSLRTQLIDKGYDERSYFAVPGGFALATQAERFLADGRPAPEPRRWARTATALLDWRQLKNPRGWAAALRNADPGRYRVLVFLVTIRGQTTGPAEVDITVARGWAEGGAARLPAAVAALPLTADHHLEVLVYEFARAAVTADPAFVPDSTLGARGHLHGAGLLGG